MNNSHIGSDVDEFPQEEGIHEEVTEEALSKVLTEIEPREENLQRYKTCKGTYQCLAL